MAAAALRAGRRTIGRSFRLHRPRGAFCARGTCHDCPVALSGDGHALACMTEASPGVSARTVGVPHSRLDLLRFPGRIAEAWPPWFSERRFLRPRSLRQSYLRVLRGLSGAHGLPGSPAPATGRAAEEEVDALVVGAGPAGLTAAAALAESGRTVLVLEAERAGGSARYLPWLAEDLVEMIGRAESASVRFAEGVTCLGLYEEEAIAGAAGPGGPLSVRFDLLVVATGAHDRPLPVRGNDLPGVIGVRGFERLAADGAFGGRLRVGADAPLAEAARIGRAAGAAGLPLAFLAGPAELPPGAEPRFPHTALLAIGGRRGVRGVRLNVGRTPPCEVLVLGFSQPSVELQLQAGAPAVLAGRPAVLVAGPRGRVPFIAVGEAGGAADPGAAAVHAEEAVRRLLAGEPPGPAASPPDLPNAGFRDPAAFACPCEDVRVRDLTLAVAEGFGHVELVKRRTGATTGPCQGKRCLAEVTAVLR
ncbi:MAG: (2Fe-2S)-binding protein, partial [Actinobacteria bacterium]|nr:(2Fe-2S)-binding protein [Actinomycetota bacterium]